MRRETRAKAVCLALPGPGRVRGPRAGRARALRRLGRLHRGRAVYGCSAPAGRTLSDRTAAGSTSPGWRPGWAPASSTAAGPRRSHRRPGGRVKAGGGTAALCRSKSDFFSAHRHADQCASRSRRPAPAAAPRSASRPALSVARTRSRWSPGVASQASATAARCRPRRPRPAWPPATGRRRPGPRPWRSPGAGPRPPRRSPSGRPALVDRRRGVSMRDSVLIGACWRPAARHPVRVEVGERGQLRSRSPTWSPRRSRTARARPCRTGKPCSIGSGCAVHPDREHRVPAVQQHGLVGVPAVNPSTERLTTWSAPASGPASSSRSFSGTPSHCALPTRSPPTSLDTQRQRHVPLDHRPVEQVVEGERDRLVDPAVDASAATSPGRPAAPTSAVSIR